MQFKHILLLTNLSTIQPVNRSTSSQSPTPDSQFLVNRSTIQQINWSTFNDPHTTFGSSFAILYCRQNDNKHKHESIQTISFTAFLPADGPGWVYDLCSTCTRRIRRYSLGAGIGTDLFHQLRRLERPAGWCIQFYRGDTARYRFYSFVYHRLGDQEPAQAGSQTIFQVKPDQGYERAVATVRCVAIASMTWVTAVVRRLWIIDPRFIGALLMLLN